MKVEGKGDSYVNVCGLFEGRTYGPVTNQFPYGVLVLRNGD